MTCQISSKGFTKSYVVGAYLPPQDRLLTSLLPETYYQASNPHYSIYIYNNIYNIYTVNSR